MMYRCYVPGDINKTARLIEAASSYEARAVFAGLYAGLDHVGVVAIRQPEGPDDGPTRDQIDPWLT